ncbi:uncharacterized protein BDW43DRAFT_212429 [Aspergillus alliaceus]|uniref:uncharacterized protein n=1 Tax=Petromyces alliaceus TaxID=209559 RepID=UPI0012A639D6|nr:uncharacterized protein BDW43DRAFT_212429 [Aspergillus alliaceus]KAB8228665.1 hypothetical protein BDW43DRAFT_212429 [Aspergillus alliaceus]
MHAAETPLIQLNELNDNGREGPEKQHSPPRIRTELREAWRFTVTSGALAASVILLVNVITLIVMYAKFGAEDLTVTFFTGSCQTASRVTVASHLIINILSTLLLAASNFSMQCLSSPTRKEVDTAHARQHWLSIGVPNLRNLAFVSPPKTILWVVLAISSVPLHMLWNSTVFQTRATNNYLAVAVTKDFLNGGSWKIPDLNRTLREGAHPGDFMPDNQKVAHYSTIVEELQQKVIGSGSGKSSPELEFLPVEKCMTSYSTDMLPERRHVLLVVDESNSADEGSSVITIWYNVYSISKDTYPLFLWMCPWSDALWEIWNGAAWNCPAYLLQHSINNWMPGGIGVNGERLGPLPESPVRHCYSQLVPEQCKASIVPIFLIVVIVCNVVKLVCFIISLRITRKDQPLCTTGDAIQSFIKQPDQYTEGRCLVAKQDYETFLWRSEEWRTRPTHVGDIWTGGRWRWGKAVRWWAWCPYIVIVCIVIPYVGIGFDPLGRGTGSKAIGSAVMSMGLGQPHQSFSLTSDGVPNIAVGFLAANIPQIIVSYIYLALNNIMTTMLAMAEWCSYAVGSKNRPKGLRVSLPAPETEQKSTYFLSIPWKWGIPITACIAVLHWAVSETVFFARIEVHDVNNGQVDPDNSVNDVFYSLIAKYITISMGPFILFALLLISIVKKYPDTMPLAGCCSASISAACQPAKPGDDAENPEGFPEDLVHKKLQWGVINDSEHGQRSEVGHATFGTEVTPLIEEKLYA